MNPTEPRRFAALTDRALLWSLVGGCGFGVGATVLTRLGAPPNSGLSATCFVRDCVFSWLPETALGERGFRMALVGVVLGAAAWALARGEYRSRGGAPLWLSFTLGLLVMVGATVFVGCPAKLHLRLAGGDPIAVAGLAGLVAGVGLSVLSLRGGYWSGDAGARPTWQGWAFLAVAAAAGVVVLFAPAAFYPAPADGASSGSLFTRPAPGYSPILAALVIGGLIGALAQHTRLCFTTGWSELFLTRSTARLGAPLGAVAGAFLAAWGLGLFDRVPFGTTIHAHQSALWAALGMLVVGFGAGLAQGCPFRQVIRAAQGDRDAAVFVVGLAVGGIAWHGLGVAVGADLSVGIVTKIGVVLALAATVAIALVRCRGDSDH